MSHEMNEETISLDEVLEENAGNLSGLPRTWIKELTAWNRGGGQNSNVTTVPFRVKSYSALTGEVKRVLDEISNAKNANPSKADITIGIVLGIGDVPCVMVTRPWQSTGSRPMYVMHTADGKTVATQIQRRVPDYLTRSNAKWAFEKRATKTVTESRRELSKSDVVTKACETILDMLGLDQASARGRDIDFTIRYITGDPVRDAANAERAEASKKGTTLPPERLATRKKWILGKMQKGRKARDLLALYNMMTGKTITLEQLVDDAVAGKRYSNPTDRRALEMQRAIEDAARNMDQILHAIQRVVEGDGFRQKGGAAHPAGPLNKFIENYLEMLKEDEDLELVDAESLLESMGFEVEDDNVDLI